MKHFAPHIIVQLLILWLFFETTSAQQSTFNLFFDYNQGVEVAYMSVETFDKNYFVTSSAVDSLIILRLNDSGDIVSKLVFSEQGYYWLLSNILLDEDRLIITGSSYDPATFEYQTFLFWVDTAFTSPTVKYYPQGAGYDGGMSVKLAFEGGYLIAGSTRIQMSPTRYDGQIYIIKVDSIGTKEWELLHGDTLTSEEPYDVIQLADSNFLVLSRRVYPSNDNFLLLKVSPDGKLIWEKELHSGRLNIGSVMLPVAPDRVLVGGISRITINGNSNAYVAMIDTAGNLLWSKYYGGTRTGWFADGDLLPDGHVVFAGNQSGQDTYNDKRDGYVVKMDTAGNVKWSTLVNPTGKFEHDINDYFYGVLATSDGGFLCTGFTGTGPISGTQDAWIMKLDSNGLCDTPTCFPWLVSVAPQPEQALLHLWPNPATDIVHINLPQPTGTLTLTNMAGKAVLRQPVHTATEQLSLHGLPPGLYVVQWIREGEAPVTGKVMVVE